MASKIDRKIDPAVELILQKHDLVAKDVLWDCHGTWCMYHRAIEQVAAKAGVKFAAPMLLENNGLQKSVAICVTGTLGDYTEWSIGEASPANCKNAYPYAMAEKRAKDRVVLKLLGMHGLVYSEEEIDATAGPKQATAVPVDPPPPPPPSQPRQFSTGNSAAVIADMCTRATEEALKAWANDQRNQSRIANLSVDEVARIREAYQQRLIAVTNVRMAG